jgi:hypothetical protein
VARKLTSNTTTGRPGFKRGGSISRFTGSFVSKTKAAKGGVRRLMVHNPAKGTSANLGTEKDIGRFTNNPKIPNVTGQQNPRVVKATNQIKGNAVASGQKRIVSRNKNRSLKKF